MLRTPAFAHDWLRERRCAHVLETHQFRKQRVPTRFHSESFFKIRQRAAAAQVSLQQHLSTIFMRLCSHICSPNDLLRAFRERVCGCSCGFRARCVVSF